MNPNNPNPFISFIAVIALIYIVYIHCKSLFDKTDVTAEEEDPMHGIPNNNGPGSKLANAYAVFDEYEQETLSCTDISRGNTIKTILNAEFKCGDHSTDIMNELQPCLHQTSCTIQSEYSNGKTYLKVNNGTLTRTEIADPYNGCTKKLDISFSCNADAQIKFIRDHSPTRNNSIVCPQQKINLETAQYYNLNDISDTVDTRRSVLWALGPKCDGYETCTITPRFYKKRINMVYFEIKDRYEFPVEDCCKKIGRGWSNRCQDTEVTDFAYGQDKELSIVYYCHD